LERALPSGREDQQRQIEEAAASSLVKQRDRDRYWSVLFAPKQKRSALLALYAFNAELDHITTVISEPMVGQIRLQWWRDAIDLAAPGTKTGNPIADALTAIIIEHRLPKEQVLAMVDARVPLLFGDPPSDIQSLKSSLNERAGALFENAAVILGARNETTRKAAAHAGLAYGLTETLLGLPFQASRQRIQLPPIYLESRGVNIADIYRGNPSPSLSAALADLRGIASRALQQFRTFAPELDRAVWPAFLPLTLVKPYLRAMAEQGHNPLLAVVSISPARRFWRIWRAARRRAI
jgi:phytoene synthase